MADLLRISTEDSLVLHFGREVEYSLYKLRPCKILFISLAVKMNGSSLKFECLTFYYFESLPFSLPLRQRLHGNGSVGTGTKLVRINLVFTRDLLDPVRIGSAI